MNYFSGAFRSYSVYPDDTENEERLKVNKSVDPSLDNDQIVLRVPDYNFRVVGCSQPPSCYVFLVHITIYNIVQTVAIMTFMIESTE